MPKEKGLPSSGACQHTLRLALLVIAHAAGDQRLQRRHGNASEGKEGGERIALAAFHEVGTVNTEAVFESGLATLIAGMKERLRAKQSG